ncbi:hypothetical protein CC80DRAFT_552927 [Byssothecium circinans]|uniref:Uncharacterized protein n=1 Tax=Byssothecium circinans TaxID=147558 RepID=A0A6A5TSD2_9PLEO|nr:hypothetical protein CC80DRAFT_552927 [Byssothecium circinans]
MGDAEHASERDEPIATRLARLVSGREPRMGKAVAAGGPRMENTDSENGTVEDNERDEEEGRNVQATQRSGGSGSRSKAEAGAGTGARRGGSRGARDAAAARPFWELTLSRGERAKRKGQMRMRLRSLKSSETFHRQELDLDGRSAASAPESQDVVDDDERCRMRCCGHHGNSQHAAAEMDVAAGPRTRWAWRRDKVRRRWSSSSSNSSSAVAGVAHAQRRVEKQARGERRSGCVLCVEGEEGEDEGEARGVNWRRYVLARPCPGFGWQWQWQRPRQQKIGNVAVSLEAYLGRALHGRARSGPAGTEGYVRRSGWSQGASELERFAESDPQGQRQGQLIEETVPRTTPDTRGKSFNQGFVYLRAPSGG